MVVLAEALEIDPLELTTTTSLKAASLADLRIRAGMSGPALAAQLGISEAYYYKIETGLRPLRPELAARLGHILGVTGEAVIAAHHRGIDGRPR